MIGLKVIPRLTFKSEFRKKNLINKSSNMNFPNKFLVRPS